MGERQSTALVPLRKLLPAKRGSAAATINLVEEETYIADREQVRRFLPDILGKVLARIWIDSEFHALFSRDPEGTLAQNGVHLPETMSIEFQKPQSDRPRIVVYEQPENSKFKMRVFYLQLIMMAGR